MNEVLDPHVANLLKSEYAPYIPVRPSMAVAVLRMPEPSDELISEITDAAEEFGVTDPIDWATFLPSVITAISTGNWLSLIPILVKNGPKLWAFIEQIIAALKHPSVPGVGPAPPNVPTITGS